MTDLRGCGMLALLQLIFITTMPKYLPLTRDIFRLSLHETQVTCADIAFFVELIYFYTRSVITQSAPLADFDLIL